MSVPQRTDTKKIVSALAQAISCPTVTGSDVAPFQQFHTLLRQLFPRLFERAQVRTVHESALLICLRGESGVRPLVFSGHMDVVAVHNPSLWRFPPFSAKVEEGYLYGRGAADMKSHLVCLLYAAESLLQNGWQPKTDIWFALSSDEERRGGSMAQMVAIMQSEGVQPAFVLDEGSYVARIYALQQQPAALIGVGENGCLLFQLTAENNRAMERLMRAATRISHIRCRRRMTPVVRQMLQKMAPHMSPMDALLVRQLPLTTPLVLHRLRKSRPGEVLTQSRLWLKAMQGEYQGDSQPQLTYQASVLHGDSVERLLMRVHRRLKGLGIRLHVQVCDEPSSLSPATGEAYEALQTAIRVHFPGVPIVPSPIAGGTDARRFGPICRNIYRFSPFQMTLDDLARIHHTDERIPIDSLSNAVSFFSQMLQA